MHWECDIQSVITDKKYGGCTISELYCSGLQNSFYSIPDQYTLIKEELYLDIYNFGKIILEILTNGRIKNVTKSIQSKPTEDLLEEICNENEVSPQDSLRKEVSLVLEVALVCTRSRSSDQPSMKDVLNLLSGSNHRM